MKKFFPRLSFVALQEEDFDAPAWKIGTAGVPRLRRAVLEATEAMRMDTFVGLRASMISEGSIEAAVTAALEYEAEYQEIFLDEWSSIFTLAGQAEFRELAKPLSRKDRPRSIADMLEERSTSKFTLDERNVSFVTSLIDAFTTSYTLISGSTKQGVRDWLTKIHPYGENYDVFANITTNDVLGLDARSTRRFAAFYDRLVTDPSALHETINNRLERYALGLLRRRARAIAETEAITAASAGQYAAWSQAADVGLFDRSKAKRRWFCTIDDALDEDVCEPMHLQTVGFDQPFKTGDGRSIMWPSAHTGCRCAVFLVIG